MKNKSHKYIRIIMSYCLVIFITGAISLIFASCEKEEEYGVPRITNIRITDPDSAQVTLTGGNLGQMVVIQGENLASTQQVFFNSESAFVNPTYVTDNNVIVRIPDDFPTEITDMVRVVTKGGEATHSFPIDIPEPIAVDFPLEWVPDGGTLVIRGNFFHNVNSIEFTGGITTANFTVPNPRTINVIVPADAESGPVKVLAVAGTATSRAHFRDNRGMMVDFDENPICWGGDAFVVDASNIPAGVPVDPISGNFYYIKQDYAAGTWWIQETVIAYCGDVIVAGNKDNYAVAFEMWVGEKWDSNWFEIEMFGASPDPVYYEWRGWNMLGGDAKTLANTGWITVKVPLAGMAALSGSSFRMGRFGSYKAQVADQIEFAFDNFRIIPVN